MSCASKESKLQIIEKHIKSYPDFPKKGVLFRDVFAVLQNPEVFQLLSDVLVETAKEINPPVETVAALDSRGFLFGPLISLALKIPFVPIRKKGKLPGEVMSYSYIKEYGQDTLEIQVGSIQKGKRVLIVDDLLATGGSLKGAIDLVTKIGGEVVASLIVIELKGLSGRDGITSDIISLIKY
ncbi:adenine phosphoribosyltransferase [Anoplophora glabripennis]|uniref:Adenine phosphoribosyltransferase n=1 Tax=Anoplophora glabripennis TaxID=217634 RepID=V5GXF8_ANOGL|nr:adenine phosphoribosyltransferase [Anoplophora glabripennis]XP_018562944.1 adenine phosphoribosyltransferase [Anoplophora glabripennis]